MLRSDRLTVVFGAVMALLSVRPAAAQVPPILPSTHVVQAGPASLYPTIALRNVGTDSNVYLESAAREDFTYTVTPRLYAVVPIGGTQFTGTGTGDLVYYRTYKDQQSVNAFFEGRYEVTSSQLRPFASASFGTHRERQGLEIDLRARQSIGAMTLGADFEVTGVTSVTGWVRRENVTWDRTDLYNGVSLAEQLNATSDLVALGARFKFTPFTTLVAVAEIQRDRFDVATERDADRLRLAPIVEFANGGAITGQVQAGLRVFRPLDPSVEGYAGVTASADLRYDILDMTRVILDGGRDVEYSFDPLQPFYLESGIRAKATQRIVGPFEAVGIVERWRLRHQRVGGRAFDGRREDTTTIGGGVGLRLRNEMELTFTVDRTNRTSTDAGRDYARRRLLASIAYGL